MQQDRIGAERVRGKANGHAAAVLAEFFDRDGKFQRAAAHAAEFFGDVDAHHVGLGQGFQRFGGVQFFLVPAGAIRLDDILANFAGGVADHFLHFCKSEIH